MTPQQLKEAKLLINDFLELGTYQDDRYGTMYYHPVSKAVRSGMEYDTSWDWLMPVVAKVTDLHNQYTYFQIGNLYDQLRDYLYQADDIGKVFKMVVYIISWFKKHKSKL